MLFFLYIPMMSRLLYAKPNEHFICLCTYNIITLFLYFFSHYLYHWCCVCLHLLCMFKYSNLFIYFFLFIVYSVNNYYVVLYKCTKIKISYYYIGSSIASPIVNHKISRFEQKINVICKETPKTCSLKSIL